MSRTYLRGDLYYADLGHGIGSEQKGTRPVVIIQNNVGNKYSPTVIIAAITSKANVKAKLPTHYYLDAGNGLTQPSLVLLEQIRTVDKRRLSGYIGRLDENHIRGINHALAVSISLATQIVGFGFFFRCPDGRIGGIPGCFRYLGVPAGEDIALPLRFGRAAVSVCVRGQSTFLNLCGLFHQSAVFILAGHPSDRVENGFRLRLLRRFRFHGGFLRHGGIRVYSAAGQRDGLLFSRGYDGWSVGRLPRSNFHRHYAAFKNGAA